MNRYDNWVYEKSTETSHSNSHHQSQDIQNLAGKLEGNSTLGGAGSRRDTFSGEPIYTTLASAFPWLFDAICKLIVTFHLAHKSEGTGSWFRAVVLKVWWLDHQPRHHLRLC